jgi:membrane protein
VRLSGKSILFFFQNDLITAAKLWNDAECLTRGAAIAFYTATALVPISAVMIQIMSFWIGRDVAAQQFALGIAGMIGPAATVGISEIAQNSKIESNSIASASISVALTIVGATTVLAEMKGAFTSIWSRSRPKGIGLSGHTSDQESSLSAQKNNAAWDFVRSRALSLAALISLTFILMVSTLLNTVSTISVQTVIRWTGSQDTLAAVISVQTVAFATSTFVTWVTMWAIFRVLLPVKLAGRPLLQATLVATGLFLIGRAVIGIYISNAPQLDLYGAAASLVVLMIWLYYAMQTVLFTACLAAVLNKD